MERNSQWIRFALATTLHFNNGAHVLFPRGRRQFQLKVTSLAKGTSVYDGEVQENLERPSEFYTQQTYFVPWQLELRQAGRRVFLYRQNLTAVPVCISLDGCSLGQVLASMPVVEQFQMEENCSLTLLVSEALEALLRPVYSKFRYMRPAKYNVTAFYATYRLAEDSRPEHAPGNDWFGNPVRYAQAVLGRRNIALKPVRLPEAAKNAPQPFGEKYVCISARASRKMQEWNRPDGWKEVTAFLKEHGYRVVCLDAENCPEGAEPSGAKTPLEQRNVLASCRFFVGVLNDAAWLAWACGKKTVLLTGCTEDKADFQPTVRVKAGEDCHCHGCLHVTEGYQAAADACPRQKDFCCTGMISAEQVKDAIRSLDGWEA